MDLETIRMDEIDFGEIVNNIIINERDINTKSDIIRQSNNMTEKVNSKIRIGKKKI